ncbi:MAG: 30S ribosomal protein S19e [Candidatus Diapherotrites archaeon]|uniref:30S ribosomal protein S19e n=1 Tax=Candidatus Iainarchaeum sp. TaxID=3101447 RepID=A0A8T4LD53_9ARCH|nr:30S ribosomal protein S19e [Candidatus Diapherotrites archaeon]
MKKVTAFDVPSALLIEDIAAQLTQSPGFKQPAFIEFVKSGAHRERAPSRADWYSIRMASVLYRVYKDGPLGTESLRTYYGGRKNRGVRPHKFTKASGKVIRLCLQTLEKEGFIKKAKKGREVTGKGQALLTKTANDLYPNIENRVKQMVENRKARHVERLNRERETKAAGAMTKRPEDDRKKDGKKSDRPKKEGKE